MIGTVYFLALFGCALAWGRVDVWREVAAPRNGSSGGGESCTCDAFLPSSTFPIKDLIVLEEAAGEITYRLELEMGKLEEYDLKMSAYAEKIVKLTAQIEVVEKNPDDYSDADLEEIKVEIKQVEALVKELQLSIKGSTTVFEALRVEITAMVGKLDSLEKTYDKNFVLATRREYIKIQVDLEECERRHQEIFNPNIGSCAHTGIIKVSKPIVGHLNSELDPDLKYGGWGKDSKPIPDRESMYWYSGYSSPSIVDIRFYTNYKNLILGENFSHQRLSSGWTGTGNNFIVRENCLYYQINSPFGLAKVNFSVSPSPKYESRVIGGASSSFSYTNSPNQNFDFSADETGLYVTYAKDETRGKLVVARINEENFGVEEEFFTSVYKPGVSNTFMVCGVLYAVKTIDIHTEEIFYMYDTKTKTETYVNVPFERFQERFSYLDYNPTDQRLYMYNDGYYVSFHLWFNHTLSATEKPLLAQNEGAQNITENM